MSFKIDDSAKAAKSGLRAARKSAVEALRGGHARVRNAVDASEKRTAGTLGAAENILIGVIDTLAQRGRAYASDGRDRVYQAEARLFPRHRRSPVVPTLLALGAGVLVSQLFLSAPKRPADKLNG